MGSRILLLAMLPTAAWGSLVSGQEIREHMRKGGLAEIAILMEYPPVDLPTLVNSAGTIGRFLVTQATSSIAGERVSTDYTVQVLSVSKGQRNLEGKKITVRRPGGTVVIEGGTLKAYDPDFPAFELAEEYVLFLKPAAEGHYVVAFGAQGAFKVEQANVTQVSKDTGTWNRERGAVALSQFLKEIATAQKRK